MNRFWILLIILVILAVMPLSYQAPGIKIGSKKFTESVVLGELISGLAREAQNQPLHYRELGGSRLVFNALVNGEIDVYPEYTGTLMQEIFAGRSVENVEQLKDALAEEGILMTDPLGFNNTYAIGMLKTRAAELEAANFSDLGRHPQMTFGVTNEFLDRADGWKALSKHYGFDFPNVRGLDHDIAFRQLAMGSVDAMDVYATDAKITSMDLQVLKDDRDFFPRYDAVILYRAELEQSEPELVARLNSLSGKIDEATMSGLNLAVEEGLTETQVANKFLAEQLNIAAEQAETPNLWQTLLKLTIEHLDLVRKSLIPAILIGIPIGIIADRFRLLGQCLMGLVGIIQTIPALALLVLVMPLAAAVGARTIGIGSFSAVLALFLYSLLPIVRNTFVGFQGIENQYRESAKALGLSSGYQLLNIELPLAMRSIMAGIKTAAVMNVGFAALGALIGAGGYGQPILTGIRLDRMDLILQGAIPAAVLALLVQWSFDLIERWVVPKGLRLKPAA